MARSGSGLGGDLVSLLRPGPEIAAAGRWGPPDPQDDAGSGRGGDGTDQSGAGGHGAGQRVAGGQYRRRAVPMPLALWSCWPEASPPRCRFSCCFWSVRPWPASWPRGRSSSAGWSWWPGWWGGGGGARPADAHPVVGGDPRPSGRALLAPLAPDLRGDAFPDHGAGGALVLGFSVANWTMDVFVLIGAFGLLGLPIPWRAGVVRLRRRSGGRQSGSGTGGSGLRGRRNDRRLRPGRRRVG